MYRQCTVGSTFQLRYSTEREVAGLYVQCKIYNSSNTLVDTVNLTETAQAGRYTGSVTFEDTGDYEAFYIPYDDVGHTTESEIAGRFSEEVLVILTETVYGGATLPPMSAITNEDIAIIVKGVGDLIGKSKSIWQEELSSGRTAEQELLVKSEFNSEKDKVKIPEINFSGVEMAIDSVKKDILSPLSVLLDEMTMLKMRIKEPKEVNLSPLLAKLADLKVDVNLRELKMLNTTIENLNRNLEESKKLLLQADELQLGRFKKLFGFINEKIESVLMGFKTNFRKEFNQLNEKLNEMET